MGKSALRLCAQPPYDRASSTRWKRVQKPIQNRNDRLLLCARKSPNTLESFVNLRLRPWFPAADVGVTYQLIYRHFEEISNLLDVGRVVRGEFERVV